jgi:hypothetical protein
MARAQSSHTDALDRLAAEPDGPAEPHVHLTKRQLLLGFVGIFLLVAAFAQTCWHARARFTPVDDGHVLPQSEP